MSDWAPLRPPLPAASRHPAGARDGDRRRARAAARSRRTKARSPRRDRRTRRAPRPHAPKCRLEGAGADARDDRAAGRRSPPSIAANVEPLPPVPVEEDSCLVSFRMSATRGERWLRAPGFAAAAIVTLALGIGATTIVYSLVDGILLRPLPIREPERVVLAREMNPARRGVQRRVAELRRLEGARPIVREPRGVARPAGESDRARRAAAHHDAPGDVESLRRARRAADCRPQAHGGRRCAGRRARRPRSATDSGSGTSAAIAGASANKSSSTTRRSRSSACCPRTSPWRGGGRVPAARQLPRAHQLMPGPRQSQRPRRDRAARAGRDARSARAELALIATQLAAAYPDTNSGKSATVRLLFDVLVRQARPTLVVLVGAVVAMLLIACVNIAEPAAGARRGARAGARGPRARSAPNDGVAPAAAHRERAARARGRRGRRRAGLCGLRAVRRAAARRSGARPHGRDQRARADVCGRRVNRAPGSLFGLVPALQAGSGRAHGAPARRAGGRRAAAARGTTRQSCWSRSCRWRSCCWSPRG